MPFSTENVDFAGGDYNTFSFAGTFSNGTDVPNGTYKCTFTPVAPACSPGIVLLRALKITGDPAVEADYEACEYLQRGITIELIWLLGTSQTFVIHR